MRRLNALLASRWPTVFPALLTVVLLAPAPVLAFKWLGDWSTPGGQFSNAPSPKYSNADFKTSSGGDAGTLTVDMGQVAGTNLQAASKIVLQRNLQITGNAEDITVGNSFITDLQNAGLSVSVVFVPLANGQGAHQVTFVNFSKNAGDRQRTVSSDRSKTRLVRYGSAANGGNYTAIVTIQYQTDGNRSGNGRGRDDDDHGRRGRDRDRDRDRDDDHGRRGHDRDDDHGCHSSNLTNSWNNVSPHRFTFSGA